MAKLTFSALVGDARYKVGGVFFGKNGSGAFVGTAALPTNPRATSQRGIRGSLSQLAYRWGWVLSDTDRQDWQTWAAAHPITDVFLHTIVLTGLAAFIWVNQNIYKVGGAIRNTPPPAFSCGNPGPVLVLLSGSPLALTITPAFAPTANEKCIIYCAPPCSPGRTYQGKRWIIVDWFPLGVAGPYDITAPWLAKWGQFKTGCRVYAQANFVNPSQGSLGTPESSYVDVP